MGEDKHEDEDRNRGDGTRNVFLHERRASRSRYTSRRSATGQAGKFIDNCESDACSDRRKRPDGENDPQGSAEVSAGGQGKTHNGHRGPASSHREGRHSSGTSVRFGAAGADALSDGCRAEMALSAHEMERPASGSGYHDFSCLFAGRLSLQLCVVLEPRIARCETLSPAFLYLRTPPP